MFLGQFEPALEAADEMTSIVTEELLRIEAPPMADWAEGFVPMRLHVLVSFGLWRDVIAEPFPDDRDLYCMTTAMLHYAKASPTASSGDIPAAEISGRQFAEAVAPRT